jgi:para-nitrobenzyl esterase
LRAFGSRWVSTSQTLPNALIALIITGTLLLAVPLSRAQQGPTVAITGGQIVGRFLSPPRGGAVFKGIPYAQPPVGELRWRVPQPVTPWTGIREATHYAAACYQAATGNGWYLRNLALRYGVDYEPPPIDRSEDCLYLNIWSPNWPPAGAKPVLVWMHGGGNVGGSGSDPYYDGESLSHHGVVVVTINYRLGPFGFLAHPALTNESDHHSSGNFGIWDELAAFRWVHENIARFGGDPERVAAFGESAGGWDAGMMMSSPFGKGLFQRVISQSGSIVGYPMTSLADAEKIGQNVTEALKIPFDDRTLERMRQASPEELMKAWTEVHGAHANAPLVIDGWLVPKNPAEVFENGNELPADLIIGIMGNEFAAPLDLDRTGLRKAMQERYGSLAPRAMALYNVDGTGNLGGTWSQWQRDDFMGCPSEKMATLHTANGNKAFMYLFSRGVPGKGKGDIGAFHLLDVSFTFRTFEMPGFDWLSFEPADYMLSEFLQRYWAHFAATGNPNDGALPQWPSFSAATDGFLEFNDNGTVSAREGFLQGHCDLYREDQAKQKK